MLRTVAWRNLPAQVIRFVNRRFGINSQLRYLSRLAEEGVTLDRLQYEIQRSAFYSVVGKPLFTEIANIYNQYLLRQPTPSEVMSLLSQFHEHFGSVKACQQAISEGNIRTHLGIRPFKLEMDITNQCNLRCIMCYFSDERIYKRKREDISVANFARIAEQIFPFCERVSLSIGTEPLLHQRFEELLSITGRYKVPMVYINTNGLLLNKNRIDAVLRSALTHISISIDGATAPTYERIRVGSSFEKVIGNIKALQTAKKLHGTNIPHLSFNFVLMRSNIRELPAMVQLAHELGIEGISATHVVRYENTDTLDETLEGEKELCNRMMDEARVLASRLGISVNFPPNFKIEGEVSLIHLGRSYFDLQITEQTTRNCCPFPWHFIGIDCYGNVVPCGWWYYPEESMGNLKTDSFEKIWNNSRYQALRFEHQSSRQRTTCLSCPAAGMGGVQDSSAFQVKKL